MKNTKVISLVITILIPLSVFHSQHTYRNINKKNISKPTILSANNFDGNRIDCDMENNGMFVSHNISGRSGLTWPKGNNTQTVFASGLWLGGLVNGEVRVTAAEFSGEFASGPWGADHNNPKHKIYKVNRSDLADPTKNADFQNWPVELGAPFVDNNNNGTYEPLPNGTDHPEFIGDQVLWMVMNDGVDSLHTVFHSNPLGVEIQRTVFGFDRRDVYGDVMFIKELIINKGSNNIEDAYVGLFSDPDLGYASDDFVGCDTTLGMGIAYNDGADANFADYSGGTPAVGYDFFQGPMIPSTGDTASMFGKKIPNMKNLNMTAFIKYVCGDIGYCSPNDVVEAYNSLQGLRVGGSEFPYGATGGTRFLNPGDPTKDTGPDDTEYVDSDYHGSGDRQFLMSSGPFNFAPGDSQEVVFGIINTAVGNWAESYLYLKEVDIIVQRAYDAQFNRSKEPPEPQVQATELSNQIILTWNDLAEQFEAINYVDVYPGTSEPTKYIFEGYNLYQVENADGSGEIIRITTFDRINDVKTIMDDVFDENYGVYVNVPVQKGTDSGIKRSINIKHDYLNDTTFINNRAYHFVVTAYSYDEYGYPKTLESSKFAVISVRPQIPTTWQAKGDTIDSGNQINYGYQIKANHTEGSSSGSVFVKVVDPTKVTGDEYAITFNDIFVENSDTLNIVNWNLINTTTDELLLENQLVLDNVNALTGDSVGTHASPIVDGLQIIVNSNKPDIDHIAVVSNAAGPLDPLRDGMAGWRFPDWLPNAERTEDGQQSTTDAVWFFNTHPAYGAASPKTFHRSITAFSGGYEHPNSGIAALIPDDFELRFTGNGKAFDSFGSRAAPDLAYDVPFEWWNIGSGTPDDPSDDYQLISWLLDDDGDGQWGLTANDHETSSGNNDPYTDRVYVHAPFDDTPGTQGHDNWWANLGDGSGVAPWSGRLEAGGPLDSYNVFSRTVLMNWNGGDVANHPNYNALEPEIGTVFRITTTKPNSSKDKFTFSTAALVGQTIEYNPNKINVWPNPYFALNPEETGPNDRQIHFTNLPESGKCTIRIFDLAGKIVRKLDHTNGSQYEIWDVRDYFSNPVASGMYIVHIETENGEKILKLAVVQQEH